MPPQAHQASPHLYPSSHGSHVDSPLIPSSFDLLHRNNNNSITNGSSSPKLPFFLLRPRPLCLLSEGGRGPLLSASLSVSDRATGSARTNASQAQPSSGRRQHSATVAAFSSNSICSNISCCFF